jgi:hypothetical protein
MALSIGKAWDETRGIIGRDGKLLTIVAAAMLVLPTALVTMVTPPQGMGEQPEPTTGVQLLNIAMALVMQVGSLAVTAVALKSGTTVGDAIATGARKLLPALGAALLFIVPMIILLAVLLWTVVGVALEPNLQSSLTAEQLGGTGALLLLAWMCVLVFFAVRFITASPVTVAESNNPVAILKRSWSLTSGHFWKLLGFVVLLGIAALLALLAAGVVFGMIVLLLFGQPEAMSMSALFLGLLTGMVQAVLVVVFATMVARIYTQLATSPGVPHVEERAP